MPAAIILRAAMVLALLAPAAALPAQQKQPEKEPPFDPYQAEKCVEVGKFYLKKGNFDAAIERFNEALRLKPGFALPHRLLSQAYEKKGELGRAIEHLEEFLRILPNGPDSGAARRKLAAIKREAEKKQKSPPNR
jgi:tetratricopeptide (TPR) repeat protein